MNYLTGTWTRIREQYAARRTPEGVRPLAMLYWRILLSFVLIVVIGALWYGVSSVISVAKTLAGATNTVSLPAPSVDPATVQALVQQFETRQSQFETLSTEPVPAIPDPSR